MEYKVISSDDHVSEGPGTWIDRVPSKMKDKVPQVHSVDGVSTWFVDGKPTERLGPVKDAEELEIRRITARFQTRPGDWDPIERLKDYTLDAVDAGVLFPNYSGFTGNPMPMIEDLEVRLECIKAYNDWLVDEFCATDPKRLVPLALIPPWNGELAVNEAIRSVKKGHKGVIFGAALDVFDYHPTWDKYWYPFYATLEDLGVPLVFHQPSATMDRPSVKNPNLEIPTYIKSAISLSHAHSLIYPTLEFLMSGILEHHPKLKVFLAESGVSWLPFTLNQLDYYWPKISRFDRNELRMQPSDYWRRQCYAGFWTDVVSNAVVKWVGEDNLMWEADYLHTIATFPQSQKLISESLSEITDERIRSKILATNCVNLFEL